MRLATSRIKLVTQTIRALNNSEMTEPVDVNGYTRYADRDWEGRGRVLSRGVEFIYMALVYIRGKGPVVNSNASESGNKGPFVGPGSSRPKRQYYSDGYDLDRVRLSVMSKTDSRPSRYFATAKPHQMPNFVTKKIPSSEKNMREECPLPRFSVFVASSRER